MRVTIVYFSGTGNTAWVVEDLAAQLRALGDEVTTRSCESFPAAQIDPVEWDMLGIAFPVHSSFAPPVMRDYLGQLPPGGKPLFAVTTAGYWAGDTAWYGAQPLTDAGYELFLCANVEMPNNFCIPRVDFLPVPPPERVERILELAGPRVARLAERIHRGAEHYEGTGLVGRVGGGFQRWGYAAFGSLLLARFYADESCTGCGWCVRHCPTRSWELRDGRARFRDRCIYCMRCYHFCPEEAIQAGEKTRETARYRRYGGPEGQPYAP